MNYFDYGKSLLSKETGTLDSTIRGWSVVSKYCTIFLFEIPKNYPNLCILRKMCDTIIVVVIIDRTVINLNKQF